MNTFSTILSTGALICSVLALILALRAVFITKKRSVRAISLRRMASLETEMLELADSQATLMAAIKKLRNVTSMRAKRAKTTENGSGEPDPITDPAAWKQYMRLQLARRGLQNA